MGGLTITCNCGHAFPEYLGRYGCPNCNGDAMTTTKRPYDDPTAKRRNIYLSEDIWQALKELGGGSPSEGIRRLYSEHTNNHRTI